LNGAKNAGILACEILGTSDATLLQKLISYKQDLKNQVLEKNEKVRFKKE